MPVTATLPAPPTLLRSTCVSLSRQLSSVDLTGLITDPRPQDSVSSAFWTRAVPTRASVAAPTTEATTRLRTAGSTPSRFALRWAPVFAQQPSCNRTRLVAQAACTMLSRSGLGTRAMEAILPQQVARTCRKMRAQTFARRRTAFALCSAILTSRVTLCDAAVTSSARTAPTPRRWLTRSAPG